MFQEWQYHHQRHLAGTNLPVWGPAGVLWPPRHRTSCVQRCPSWGHARSCPWSCPKRCAGNAGTLLAPVKRLPQILNQRKDWGGDEEGETYVKPAGYWGGGLEQRSTSQFWGTRRYVTHHHHCSSPPNRAASEFLPHLPFSPLPLPCLSACSFLPYTCDSPVQLRIGLRPV